MRVCKWIGAIVAGSSLNALASPAFVQPNAAESQDVFAYQFLGNSNLNAPVNAGQFGTFDFHDVIGVVASPSTHNMKGFLKFNTTNLSLGASESAAIGLWSRALPPGFGANPSSAFPTTIDAYAATSSWDESTLTWAQQPSASASPVATFSVSGIDQWITFDITSQLQSWIDSPSTNFGLVLVQRSVVNTGTANAGTAFSSGEGVNGPYLQIIPEPASATLLLGTVSLFARKRRGR